jgi:hypothetical protein
MLETIVAQAISITVNMFRIGQEGYREKSGSPLTRGAAM